MNKIKYFLACNSIFISSITFAEPIKDFSIQDVATMDQLLSREKYIQFYEIIKSNLKTQKVSDEAYIKYLVSKKDEGHVPLYWLMSDYYSTKNDVINSQTWFYTSLIMTQQDAFLCTDVTAKDAPRKLKRLFPKPENISRHNPQNNQKILPNVFFFIENLRIRSNPTWACIYGDGNLKGNEVVTIPKTMWRTERQRILEKFKEPLLK